MAATFPTKTSSTNGNGAVPSLQSISSPTRTRRPVLDPSNFDASYYPDAQPRNMMQETRLRLFSGTANLVRVNNDLLCSRQH